MGKNQQNSLSWRAALLIILAALLLAVDTASPVEPTQIVIQADVENVPVVLTALDEMGEWPLRP